MCTIVRAVTQTTQAQPNHSAHWVLNHYVTCFYGSRHLIKLSWGFVQGPSFTFKPCSTQVSQLSRVGVNVRVSYNYEVSHRHARARSCDSMALTVRGSNPPWNLKLPVTAAPLSLWQVHPAWSQGQCASHNETWLMQSPTVCRGWSDST